MKIEIATNGFVKLFLVGTKKYSIYREEFYDSTYIPIMICSGEYERGISSFDTDKYDDLTNMILIKIYKKYKEGA